MFIYRVAWKLIDCIIDVIISFLNFDVSVIGGYLPANSTSTSSERFAGSNEFSIFIQPISSRKPVPGERILGMSFSIDLGII